MLRLRHIWLGFISILSFISITCYAQETTTTIITPAATSTPATTTIVTPAGSTSLPATTTQVVVEKPVIVTAVPALKETVNPPENYVRCFVVKAGWYADVWVAEHRVCQYENSPLGSIWVEGYWQCNKYSGGQCTNWDWKAAHWENKFIVY